MEAILKLKKYYEANLKSLKYAESASVNDEDLSGIKDKILTVENVIENIKRAMADPSDEIAALNKQNVSNNEVAVCALCGSANISKESDGNWCYDCNEWESTN